jgi:hypothetical protein
MFGAEAIAPLGEVGTVNGMNKPKRKKSTKNRSSIEFLGINVSNARKCEHDPSCIVVDLTVLLQFFDDEPQIPVQRMLTLQLNDPFENQVL